MKCIALLAGLVVLCQNAYGESNRIYTGQEASSTHSYIKDYVEGKSPVRNTPVTAGTTLDYQTTTIAAPATSERRPSLDEVSACMQSCRPSMECYPVCGTDGITYTNPAKLLCSQFCGIDVKVSKFSPCLTDKKSSKCFELSNQQQHAKITLSENTKLNVDSKGKNGLYPLLVLNQQFSGSVNAKNENYFTIYCY